MRLFSRATLCGILLLATLAQPAPPARADATISAAISLKGVLEKAQPALEKAAGDKISFNFGASGTLAGQIRQGAPVDLFLSADRANITQLVEANVCDKTTIQVIAGNALVLITPQKPRAGVAIASFADLTSPSVKRIAIGEPKVVPAGAYAQETLTNLHLWDPLQKANTLVTAENVAQVLSFVQRGEVDAGLVYATDAQTAKNVKVIATAEAKLHAPIEYVSAIVTTTRHRPAAESLQKALLSPPLQKLLSTAGFTPPPPPPAPTTTTAPSSATQK